ncbi:hypothetical protein GCM10022198_22850 [Klugiella xanthotipulae]|uniref:Uncharacterized protein n=1 Tax=Klugiella xanthotipulae TaxID=244735 RepID=A0A543HYJ2_9MICO|nr:hypothetical protein [Klugiella xanthotipulae]TQM63315.1 hypothetical protein FB466_1575 [Klugiella xanthotipulae]
MAHAYHYTRRARDSHREWQQPSVTTASGEGWLIAGALGVIFATGSLAWMSQLTFFVPVGGIAGVLLTFIGMVVVRFTVIPRRRRLLLLAAGMGLLWLIAVGCALTVVITEWAQVPNVIS